MINKSNFSFNKLTPFKFYILENFPFIEEDFDALTDWQLFCKIGKKINTIIQSNNTTSEQVELLTQSYNNLIDYVNNYFNNFDIQKELKINNAIFLGDSYTGGYTPDEGTLPENQRFWFKFATMLGIENFVGFNEGGIGFYQKVNGINFLKLLQNHASDITNKNDIDCIFVFGGYNDAWENTTTKVTIHNEIEEFMNYVKNEYPNAKVCISQIGYNTNLTDEGTRIRNNLLENITKGYADSVELNYIYLPNIEFVLHDKDLMSSDGIHPTSYGHQVLATALFQAYTTTYNYNFIRSEGFTPQPIENGSVSGNIYSYNDNGLKYMRLNNLIISFEQGSNINIGHNGYIIAYNNSKTVIPIAQVPINVNCHVRTYDNTSFFVNATLVFNNNNISISFNDFDNNNWRLINNIHYIEFMNTDVIEDVHYL